MNKALLLTAASIIALCAGGASAAGLPAASFAGKYIPFRIPKGAKVLWNQNQLTSNAGTAVISQNFTSGDSTTYDCQGADDFVIPKGKTWRITEVDVTGMYEYGELPATSENVIFYKDRQGMPGKTVKKGQGAFTNLDGGGGPNFAIKLPGNGLKLKAGHYWVSVIANMDYPVSGVWFWEVNRIQQGDQAMWQNPPGGYFTCRTWGTIESCVDSPSPDFMFELRGTSE
ncbi:MAG TPA: hypothetical protein VHX61_03565 [Rhizomicrobium sp.]|jgi:hypothetical protein|nr:hypothetical protein [Rhizomicrobium sp.]